MSIRKILYLLIPLAIMASAAGCAGTNYDQPLPVRSSTQAPSQIITTRPQVNLDRKPAKRVTRRNPKEIAKPRRVSSRQPHTYLVRGADPQIQMPAVNQTSAADTTLNRGNEGQNPQQQTALQPQQINKLASNETEFNAKEKNRSTNISRAAESINGKVIQPGEIFSFNETVGPTIERRGYKEDVIFIDGEKSKGFGGGVCQVSTTLHNAAEEAGMTILERHDHSRPVGYAKSGEEAATSYGGIDFKFQNDKPHAVRIVANATDGKISVSIHSV